MTSSTIAWGPPVSFLPKPLLEPRRPLVSILVGWLTALVPSILLGALVSLLLPNLEQPKIAIPGLLELSLFVIVAPVIETLIMAGVLALLLKFLPPTVAVFVSAVGWGIAHSLAAPAWGFVIWWLFLVFSVLYVTWRKHSLLAALAVPAATHALQNLLPSFVILLAGVETG
ncbi:MAG TPA: CPBP family glutamic-type intramembrane protease [Sphingomicrobium sp.]|nr:CPBP family glutamic-type intramembrane protease [Sphingomicrobium sp.]